MTDMNSPRARAVLFDLDGTLTNTEQVSAEEFCRASGDCGHALELFQLANLFGRRTDAVNAGLLEMFGPEYPIEAIRALQQEYVEARYLREGVQPIEGAHELLLHLESHDIPRAVGTSSRSDSGFDKLRRAGLIHQIPSLTGGESVQHSKPAPDTWHQALEGLNSLLAERSIAKVQAHECLVVGDSDNDVISGYAAGMIPIRIPGIVQAGPQAQEIAALVAASMREASDFICDRLGIPRLG